MIATIHDRASEETRNASLEFVLAQPSATYNQWPDWREISPPSSRQTYLDFQVRDSSDALVSAGLLRLTWIVGGTCFAAVQRGPVTPSVQDLPGVLAALEAEASARGAVNLTVNPFWLGDECDACEALLEQHGYIKVSRDLQNMPTTTAVIDLRPSEDDIFAGFNGKVRSKVRQSQKLGIEVSQIANADEADILSAIMRKMASDRSMEIDNQYNIGRFHAHIAKNPQAGLVMKAVFEGKMFGGAVALAEGTRAGLHLLASDPETQRGVPRTQLLLWEMTKILKGRGFTDFDLIGFPDDRYDEDAQAESRGLFKSAFKPATPYVTALMVKPLRPVAHHMMTRGRKIYRSKIKPLLRGAPS
ncbi:MAG: peptidoglycan bridge formation glycyltransferase FemA/FemB family protein [Pseudomonadota bacterium]